MLRLLAGAGIVLSMVSLLQVLEVVPVSDPTGLGLVSSVEYQLIKRFK